MSRSESPLTPPTPCRSRSDAEKSVILVGNGGMALDHELGNDIDAFGTVIRMNNFQTRGYEKYVGTRTTIWARNNAPDIAARDSAAFQKVLICTPRWALDKSLPIWVRLRRRVNFIPVKRLRKQYPVCEVVRPETVARVEVAMGITDPRRTFPSTGIIAIAHAVERYGTVWIHGFDHFTEVAGAPRHYFNDAEPITKHAPHDPVQERCYVTGLMREGHVRQLLDSRGP